MNKPIIINKVLPAEVRVQIWKETRTRTPQYIWLSFVPPFDRNILAKVHIRVSTPATWSLNTESREETIHDLCRLFSIPSNRRVVAIPSDCVYAPEIDIVVIPMSAFSMIQEVVSIFQTLRYQSPADLDSIRTLHVVGRLPWSAGPDMTNQAATNIATIRSLSTGQAQLLAGPIFRSRKQNLLDYFHNLQTVKFYCSGWDWVEGISSRDVENPQQTWKEDITTAIRHNQEMLEAANSNYHCPAAIEVVEGSHPDDQKK